jgi:phosphoribosylglycinamide formyltransferase-1
MNKNYAFYCSGGASRIIKFYSNYILEDYPFSFVLYDGNSKPSMERMEYLFSERLYLKETKYANQSISEILLELLRNHNVDYLFCFGNKILKSPLIDIYKNRIINFHPSILPSFPGLNAIDQALKTSVQLLGNTAHFIDSGIDTGPIILQSVISRAAYDNYENVLGLQLNMLKIIWQLLDEDRINIIDNKVIIIDYPINNEKFYSI